MLVEVSVGVTICVGLLFGKTVVVGTTRIVVAVGATTSNVGVSIAVMADAGSVVGVDIASVSIPRKHSGSRLGSEVTEQPFTGALKCSCGIICSLSQTPVVAEEFKWTRENLLLAFEKKSPTTICPYDGNEYSARISPKRPITIKPLPHPNRPKQSC